MTAANLLVLAPWLIFGAGLAAVCYRLLSRRSAGQRIQGEVDATGQVVGLEAGHQLGRGVLQAQREQQQDDTDLRAGRGELRTAG